MGLIVAAVTGVAAGFVALVKGAAGAADEIEKMAGGHWLVHQGFPKPVVRGGAYVRRFGRYARLRAAPGSAAFHREYANALERLENPSAATSIKAPHKGTLGWLASVYFGSPEFCALDPISQRTRRGIIGFDSLGPCSMQT